MTITATTDQDARRRRTVVWVVALATIGLIFDGYDLVVYGAVVSTFLKDPSQIGSVTPAMAGTLGSYALLGMMCGALLAGAFGDILGRRKVMLIAYAWFSVGMFITALMSTTTTFGVMRFLTGLGIGALIASTATLVTEIAPPGKKNLCSAISYAGVPLGSLVGALLAILLLDAIGWRGLFMIGALPILTLYRWHFSRCPSPCRGWWPGVSSTRRGPSPSRPVCRCPTASPRPRRPKRSVSQDCSAAVSGSRPWWWD